VQKHTISRDDAIYEAFPDVVLTASNKLVCVFAECTHHRDRGYTRVMLTDSHDRGRTWSPKRPLGAASHGLPYYNCPRLTALRDGRLALMVDTIGAWKERQLEDCLNWLYLSEDEGATWTKPLATPARGIVPDKLIELDSGRWIISCHWMDPAVGNLVQRLWYTDDQGGSWSEPVIVGRQEGLNLCEGSLLPLGDGAIACFLRENSGLGRDAYKVLSSDGGESWSEPIRFPLPGCHRPVAGWLQNGQALITHRYMQGGDGWVGYWTQNVFAALTDRESVLALRRNGARTRILPLDYDRSPESDLGYTGWVQFDDGEIYVVNYIMDDAPKAQIRGYSLSMDDLLIES